MPPPVLPPTFSDTTPLVNGLALRRDPLAFFARLAREVGPAAHYQLGSGTVYFFNDPALIREVLVREDASFLKWEFNAGLHEVVGDGLLTSEGPRHQHMARLLRPAFHQGHLPDYARQMVALTHAQLAHWPDDAGIDLGEETIALTLDIVAQVLFGVTLGEQRAVVRDAGRTVQLLSDRLGSAPDDDRAVAAAVARLDTVSAEILAERRRLGQPDDDLLALLLHGQDAAPDLVTDAQIRAEIRTFLIAGHLTIASVIAAACWLLARDPDAQAALCQHLDDALDGRPPGLEDLPALAPCEHVLLETLRLYPSVWVLGREAAREVQIGEWTLPAGAKVVIVPWLLHRNTGQFPDPETFRPDRWRDDARSRLPRGSYLPFSAGARSCLGERFALLEGALVLATILGQWQFRELPDRPDPGWNPQLLLWPRQGIRLHATRRVVPVLLTR